ncbi:cytochrome P450 [Mycobacterium sp.]|uniref:cytochrome P450 n=1 Tax=Mycobacterium sp. TaxID=1785 RepID=UPI003C74168D
MTTVNTAASAKGCPVVESYQPTVDEQLVDPFSAWAVARRETPVFFAPALGAYVVTRYDDICAITNDPQTFSNSDILKPLKPTPPEVAEVLATGFDPSKLGAMIMLDPPEHEKIRRSLSARFTPKRIAQLEHEIHTAANDFIDRMQADSVSADFVEAFAYPLPLRIISRLLGVPSADSEQLHEWATFKLALQFGDMPLDEHVRAAHGYVDFQRYVANLIDQKRADPEDDLISAMLAPTADGEVLDDVVLVGQVMGLVNAGHETTTTVLTMGLYHLLSNREQWEMLCAKPGLAAAAAEESLRFDGPIKQLWRRATRDVEVGGVPIPRGARIAIVNGSANRDESVFDAPERFDIAKKRDKAHLAFGRGTHYCLGANLARSEARISFEMLSARIPSIRLATGAPTGYARNVTVRMPLGLLVEWDG